MMIKYIYTLSLRKDSMCFNVSISKFLEYIENRFNAKFAEPERYEQIYYSSAFGKPYLPVVSSEAPDKIQFYQWGLIPFWTKDEKTADRIRMKTFNAKAETIFEKPSFRTPIISKRCLVLVDGFYEWHHEAENKYPYYIHMTGNRAFALAGIWDRWENKNTGAEEKTFSIITTAANPLLERIHNTKKRMPVILKQVDEPHWLSENLDPDDILAMLKPYDGTDLEAHTVSKLISSRGKNKNIPNVQQPYDYGKPTSIQTKL